MGPTICPRDHPSGYDYSAPSWEVVRAVPGALDALVPFVQGSSGLRVGRTLETAGFGGSRTVDLRPLLVVRCGNEGPLCRPYLENECEAPRPLSFAGFSRRSARGSSRSFSTSTGCCPLPPRSPRQATLLVTASAPPPVQRGITEAMADAPPNARTGLVAGAHLIDPAAPEVLRRGSAHAPVAAGIGHNSVAPAGNHAGAPEKARVETRPRGARVKPFHLTHWCTVVRGQVGIDSKLSLRAGWRG